MNCVADLLVTLAVGNETVFEVVREAAEEYVCDQLIDDAFPWTPNPQEVFLRARTLKCPLPNTAETSTASEQGSLFRTFDVLQSKMVGPN